MMLIVIILLFFYCLHIYFDARWDAELLNPGDSKHIWKTLRITALFLIVVVFYASARVLYWEWFWWLKSLIMALIYPFEREMLFDPILNHYRKKPDDYKTSPLWFKWLSGFIMLGLTTLICFI